MTSTLERSVSTIAESKARSERRNVDLALSLRLCDVVTDEHGARSFDPATQEELITIGGCWDRKLKRWSSEAESVRVERVHRGQEPSARWLAEWFRRRAIGPRGPHWDAPMPDGSAFKRAYTLMLFGGRRAGKTHLACLALVMFAIMMSKARVFAVSPTQEETDELEQALRGIMPRRWYEFRGGGAGKSVQFKLVNGSRILCLSGHRPSALKRGRVDLALYNEGQLMSEQGWIHLRGAVADCGGIVMIAANPPDTEIGEWVEELHKGAREDTNGVGLFELSADNNPFVDLASLKAMSAEINDENTYDREVGGKIVPIGDVVHHAWSDSDSIRAVPRNFIDVTARETRRELGKAAGYVVGMDFQRTPHMAAAVLKFFEDPAFPGEAIPWVVDYAIVEDADENDLIDELERKPRWQRKPSDIDDTYRGWIEPGDDPADPVHCAVVMDASAMYQDGAHRESKNSDRMIRARRWTHLHLPQGKRSNGTDILKNPDIVTRCKVANSMLKNKAGRRRLFSEPACEPVNEAMKKWPNKNGIPNRRSQYAHMCDAVTYVVYRFCAKPRGRGGAGGGKFETVTKFTRRDELKGM